MKLFNRQKDGNQTPPVTQEYYIPDKQVSTSRVDWKRAVPRILALVLIIGLVVFGVILGIGALTDDEKPTAKKDKPESSLQQAAHEQARADREALAREKAAQKAEAERNKAEAAREAQAERDSAAAARTAEARVVSEEASNAAPRSTANNSDNGKLADSGPGETLAIFVVATLAGTLGYQSILRRRALD